MTQASRSAFDALAQWYEQAFTQGRLPLQGFVGQEAVALGDFLANRFGSAYAREGDLVH